MTKYSPTTLLLSLLLLTACQPETPEQDQGPEPHTAPAAAPKNLSAAEQLLDRTVEAHGGDRYNMANYGFVFRGKDYTFANDGTSYRYSVTTEKDGAKIVDVLDNGKLTRTVGGKETELSAKDQARYGEALNSVIYFATLPHKLQDPAVQLTLLEPTTIQGKPYHTLMVQFAKEGGGKDHDDNFRYWVNQQTNRIDYLAYDYKTNKGGVRFRSAYNPRVVDGILFQDYVNYKAPLGTNLDSLPAMFDRGELAELSRIETEEVGSLER